MKNKIRIGSKEKEIIKLIGLGLLVSASIIMPGLPVILKPFFHDTQKRRDFNKRIEKLKNSKIIYLSGNTVRLSLEGQQLFKLYEVDKLKIKKHKWDQIWRVVSYDIPNKYKKEREYFRRKLLELGFIKIQESLMLVPYKCKKEIAVIAQNLKISPYVIYLTTKKLPNRDFLIQKFKLG